MSARQPDPKRWHVLIAVMLAFLPVVLDMTILHVAVPTLTQSLGASSTEVLWIIDIYPLLMAGLLVPMGTLADRVGNRRILLTGLTIFGLASGLAAFAQTPPMLIAARMLLALGGSMIMPCVLGIIRRTFEDEGERGMALGLWGTVGAAGAAVGPLIGGALLGHFWWGSVFLINVPVMLIVAPACWFLLPRLEENTPGHWAIGQAILLILGMISVVYAIKAGFGAKQSLGTVLLVLAFGVTLLVLFARKQLHAAQPMLDLSLFARPAIVAGMIMAIVASGALAGVELTLAQELQYVLDKTPLQAGVFMIPIMAAAALGGPVAGWLSSRFGLRLVASLSLVVSALALAWLAFTDFHDPGLIVSLLLAVLGLALSIGLTASSIAIMGSVEASKGGAAGSLEATGYELGTGLGITLFGVFMSGVFGLNIALPEGLPAAAAEQAARSIGDSYLVAHQLATEQGGGGDRRREGRLHHDPFGAADHGSRPDRRTGRAGLPPACQLSRDRRCPSLAGGGRSRFSTRFEERDSPSARQWRVTAMRSINIPRRAHSSNAMGMAARSSTRRGPRLVPYDRPGRLAAL